MIKQTCLHNGLTLFTAQTSHVHSVSIQFVFRGGVIYEDTKVHGISHFLEHLFFRRMGELPQKELYEQINEIGGVLKGCTYRDMIQFNLVVSPKHWKKAVQLLLPLIENHTWTDDEIERERQVVLRQIEFGNLPVFEDYFEMRRLKGTKYDLPIMGTSERISKLTSQQIHTWKSKIFSADNACVVVSGNLDNSACLEIKDMLENRTVQASNILERKEKKFPKDFCKRTDKHDIVLQDDTEILDVTLLFDVDVEKYNEFEISLLSSILGEGDGSRLSMRLREEFAYTDEVFSRVNYYHSFAILSIVYSVRAQDLIKSLQVAISEITRLKADLQEKDLRENIAFFTDNMHYFYDSPRKLASEIGWRWIRGCKFFEPEKIAESYESLKLPSLKHTANDIFQSSNLSIYVSNNTSIISNRTLKKELRSLRFLLDNDANRN